MEGLLRCSANYVPLSPISFIERAASVYRDRISIVYGTAVRYTWKETQDRCVRLASALARLGISRGDVVAVLAPNIPAMYELHFGVPMAGAVLCTLNTRHNSTMMSVLLKHSEAKLLFVDSQLLEVAHAAIDILTTSNSTKAINKLPRLVLIPDEYDQSIGSSCATTTTTKTTNFTTSRNKYEYLEYESLIANTGGVRQGQDDEFEIRRPMNELDPISLNYTSGTTASPKGVVYNHRGAYLNALATVIVNGFSSMPVYLWTVPMFHCNGWSFVWAVAAQGGTNVCLRKVSPQAIFDSIALYKVTNMAGAPTVLNTILNAPPSVRKPLAWKVEVTTGGAPPPPQVILKMEELGFVVTHCYGLTEISGVGTACTWKPEWDSMSPHDRAKMKSRQGLNHIAMEAVDVKDPVTMKSVPADGKTIGEVMFKGNPVMSGYLKDLKATKEALKGGWFRTGDLGVRHLDGYLELKGRSKDIIISGGENINTTEVESVLLSHPAVLDAAVVGRPDDHWGETPCAFVELKELQGHNCASFTAEDIIKFCRERLPHYMAPRTIVFNDLPKTSTGKTQKFVLWEKAKAMGSLSNRNDNSKL